MSLVIHIINDGTTDTVYRKSACCGGRDCDLRGRDPGEPCWGEVGQDSCGDDEDGWPIPSHLCRGHRNAFKWSPVRKADCAYVPCPAKEIR